MRDGRTDINDVYVFNGARPDRAALAMTVNPVAGDASPTTFRPGAKYLFHVDNDGDAYGYRPLDDVAAMWRARVRENPGDYLSRTRLGRTLLSLARESGDLPLYERAEAHLRRAAADAPNDAGAVTGPVSYTHLDVYKRQA